MGRKKHGVYVQWNITQSYKNKERLPSTTRRVDPEGIRLSELRRSRGRQTLCDAEPELASKAILQRAEWSLLAGDRGDAGQRTQTYSCLLYTSDAADDNRLV